jgi:hypothetical protein
LEDASRQLRTIEQGGLRRPYPVVNSKEKARLFRPIRCAPLERKGASKRLL